MEGVDYVNTFIAVADDCPVTRGTPPPLKPDTPSVAARTYQMIADHPYGFTAGDVIFTVFADRRGIPRGERAQARAEFYAKGQPCLRASDLGKRYGWGVHADADGRVALYGMQTAEYAELATGRWRGAEIATTKAMRRARRSR
ncbi:MAG: hypothetical protein JOZ47_11195 [Kutzneria sp.]|nr:hypothetical protein [Kutzneria sp.]MBV9845627.1 hypothetical protein [Kutzneria sp.]